MERKCQRAIRYNFKNVIAMISQLIKNIISYKNKLSSEQSFYQNILLNKHLIILLFLLNASFFYGVFIDKSVPFQGIGWADQSLYTDTVTSLKSFNLPSQHQLQYAIWYPLLGVLGSIFTHNYPFLLVSYFLYILSAIFVFIAFKNLSTPRWALAFCTMLFYWQGTVRCLYYPSEIFFIPWNNQVLFFSYAFFLWIFTCKIGKLPSNNLLTVISFVSAISIGSREESVLFILPLLFAFLVLNRVNFKKYLLVIILMCTFISPQIIAKYNAFSSILNTARQDSYNTILTKKYFQIDQLKRNVNEVLIDSSRSKVPIFQRKALFQASPWLWLSIFGFIYIFFKKKYTIALKIYILMSFFLLTFYLSGVNMSAQKLAYHCIRYITPSLIAMNLSIVLLVRDLLLIPQKHLNRFRMK